MTAARLLCVLFVLSPVAGVFAQAPSAGLSRDELQPLTQFRQQHRRTVDGRLCAAAFVQNRETFTGSPRSSSGFRGGVPFYLRFAGCTDTPSPSGASGRPWCYTEAQLSQGGVQSWEYCAPVVDYDALRRESTKASPAKVSEVREYVGKLGKAQRAAEVALDMYQKQCASRPS